jgi:iron complex outermembrane receptor protein
MSLTLALLLAGQIAAPPAGQEPAPVSPGVQATAPDDTPAEGEVGRTGPAVASPGGDIVVTARRRAETVQSVPIAISVIGGTAIAETGAYNVSRITQLQPTLQFYSTNPRNSAANIRGLGAPFGLTNDGIEQGVGIYVDQVYYSRIASATFDFTDTERIEIVRPASRRRRARKSPAAISISSRARRRSAGLWSRIASPRACPPRSPPAAGRSTTFAPTSI